MSNDNMYKYPDADRFSLLDDQIALGIVSTDERIRVSGTDQIIGAKNIPEEPIRAAYSKEGFTIYVLPKDRTV
jgi:hypothetical protein